MELISCAPSLRLFVVRWVAAFGTKKQSQTTNPPAALAHRATGARNSQRSFRCRSMELIGCAAHLRPLVVRLVAAFGAKNEGACNSLAACTVSVAQLQISVLVPPIASVVAPCRLLDTAARHLSIISKLQLAFDMLPLVAHVLVASGIDAAWDKALSSRPRHRALFCKATEPFACDQVMR